MKRVAFHTLGCKLNFSESSEIGRMLEDEGFVRVPFGEEAEVTVIHSCSVTGSADRKTRQAIHKAVNSSPDGFIVAMGCTAQLKPEELASWNGVDLVLGTHEKFDLPQYLTDLKKRQKTEIHSCSVNDHEGFHHAHSESERTRAFLKVQDGCDYVCSYCTIPAARGKSRNPPVNELIGEARRIASSGIREIVLTGVNVGDFGRSTGETFSDLVYALDKVNEILRFRISSIEPNLLNDDLILFLANAKRFAPHFHLPLQSGSDKILKLMKRRYMRELFADRVNRIKELLPHAAIGADVIVGFPGETDEDFEDVKQFLEKLPLSYLHVFTYSERPGTPASELPGKVPNRIRDFRSQALHALSDTKKRTFIHAHIGFEDIVIVESRRKNGNLAGFTANYIEVEIPFKENLLHKDCRIKLTHVNPSLTMAGQLI